MKNKIIKTSLLLLISNLLFAQNSIEEVEKLIKSAKEQPGIGEKIAEQYYQIKERELGVSEKEKEKEIEKVPSKDSEISGAPESPSSIELMFRENYPIRVLKTIYQFGYNIFSAPSTTFTPLEVFPVPLDYILGPDDEIIINIWGKVQETIKVKVDREGKIILPKAGATYIWGLKFEDAKSLINRQLEANYTNLECNITMGSLRSIKVFILGNVSQPGTYTVSSLATVLYALHSAGGPTRLGSLRNIKVISRNKKVMDLYDILLYGNKENDYALNSGDIIFIPQIGKVVGIAGNVKQPAIYEVKPNETLKDVFEMAGGVTPIGYLKRIQIERIEEHSRKVTMDMEFNNISEFTKQVADFELKDGDLILVSPILPKKYNYVSIFGNIERPGDYELKKGIMVKDLIGEAQGLLPGTYLKRGEVSRFKANQIREILPFNVELALTGDPVNNLQLQEWDKVMVYAETDVLPECFAKVTGAVSTEGEYKITPNMTIEDLIFESGGYLSTADIKNAELCRMVPEARPMTMKIDLTDSATKKIKLEPNDWLFIRERREWVERQKITITGEVTYPGQYVVEEGERLKSVIERAGGVTKDAFLEGAIYIRQSVKKEQESALRNFLASTKKRLLEESATAELAGAGEIKVIEYREKLLGLISEIRIPGRIQVDLKKLNLPQFNIVIADGDTLYIPKTPTTVQIIGCVYNPSSVLYEEEADMGWYLEQVGGLTRDANKKEIYILKASGKVVKSGKIYRGDTIIVPEGLKIHAPTGKVIKDLATVIYQLGLSALMVSTLMK